MKIFKRKPKCQRKNGKHFFTPDPFVCIHCGISLVELDRGYKRMYDDIKIIDCEKYNCEEWKLHGQARCFTGKYPYEEEKNELS